MDIKNKLKKLFTQGELKELLQWYFYIEEIDDVTISKPIDDVTTLLSNQEWYTVLWDNVPYGNGDNSTKKSALTQKVVSFLK